MPFRLMCAGCGLIIKDVGDVRINQYWDLYNNIPDFCPKCKKELKVPPKHKIRSSQIEITPAQRRIRRSKFTFTF